ncbi:hypothetical protein Tco_1197972 [Tanacetum coccineum]
MYALRVGFLEKVTWELQVLDLVSLGVLSYIIKSMGICKGSRTKGSVKASGILGASGSFVTRLLLLVYIDLVFSHVSFVEYIYVTLSGGLLISGKADLTCAETLYGWVVGFDEVLVAESNMTKIIKMKIWFSLENSCVVWRNEEDIVGLWRLMEPEKNFDEASVGLLQKNDRGHALFVGLQ